ncbi:MAG: DUF2510 domain-containing protein [Mycobacteriales bacterium]
MPVQGWYDDPFSEAPLRWWDGSQWTDVVSPIDPPRGDRGGDGGGGENAEGGGGGPAPGRGGGTPVGMIAAFMPLVVILAVVGMIAAIGYSGVVGFLQPSTPQTAANKFFQRIEVGDYTAAHDNLCTPLRGSTTPDGLKARYGDTVSHKVTRKATDKDTATVSLKVTFFDRTEHNFVLGLTHTKSDGWQVCQLP